MPRTVPKSIEVEGNNGGSFIAISEVGEGLVHLRVGENCVMAVDTTISVVALAAILAEVRYRCFEQVLKDWADRTNIPLDFYHTVK